MAFAPPSTADLCGEAGQLNWLRFSPQLSLCKLHYPVPNRTRISPVVTTVTISSVELQRFNGL
jgi:hypothetical protein